MDSAEQAFTPVFRQDECRKAKDNIVGGMEFKTIRLRTWRRHVETPTGDLSINFGHNNTPTRRQARFHKFYSFGVGGDFLQIIITAPSYIAARDLALRFEVTPIYNVCGHDSDCYPKK